MLEYIILGLLMYGEMSGYDLKQKMSKSTSNFFDSGYGSIYPALKRMENKRIISSREIVEEKKYKKLYSITESGKLDFMNWLEQPIEFSRIKPDHLTKIFFFEFLPKEKAISNLNFFINEVESFVNTFAKYENQVKEQYNIYQFSTFSFGLSYYEYIVKWSNNFLNQLND